MSITKMSISSSMPFVLRKRSIALVSTKPLSCPEAVRLKEAFARRSSKRVRLRLPGRMDRLGARSTKETVRSMSAPPRTIPLSTSKMSF